MSEAKRRGDQAVAKLQSGDRLLVTINGETRLATVGNRIMVQSCHAKSGVTPQRFCSLTAAGVEVSPRLAVPPDGVIRYQPIGTVLIDGYALFDAADGQQIHTRLLLVPVKIMPDQQPVLTLVLLP